MINSFWNICSTCPMPREEKLNSEYKRNFVWHPQYKPLSQDVISVAPYPVNKDVMQRKKQYPELAYRSHEVIRHDISQSYKDAPDSRARSEERDNVTSRSGPRSRSAEPTSHQQQKLIMIQSFPPIASGRAAVLPKTDEIAVPEHVCETSEYKSQYAWPKKPDEKSCTARKSVSMGVLKGTDEADVATVPKVKLAPVHRPCAKQKNLQSSGEKLLSESKKKNKTEYKAKYKPFTSYVYMDGQWKKTSRLLMIPEKPKPETNEEPWFVEVVERLQKANEYRWRGHGQGVYGEHLPDIYKQPIENSVPRSKASPANLQLHLPKVYDNSKKDVKKKEHHFDAFVEKKRDKDAKPTTALRRPKSAEPAKAKEQVKHKRPATTPPAKMTATQVSQIRKNLNKEKDVKMKASKQNTSKKLSEDNRKQPTGKKSQNSPHNASSGSGGKVWLQAGQNISEHPPAVDDPALRERTDAVRPSSLLPTPPAPLPEDPMEKSAVDSNHTNQEVIDVAVKPIMPHVVPLTHVRTPEEVTGVKSPDPENWTVPIESSERLEWSGVNTASELPPRSAKPLSEQISEKITNIPTSGETVPGTVSEESDTAASSAKLTSANVLDRARSRLDQFWGKNK